jgi:N-terminal acetyltransferase B complex non-catalytic subunit
VTSSLPEHERLHSPLYQPGFNQFHCKGCYQSCGAYCGTCLENLAYGALRSYGKAINNDDIITNKLLPTDRHPADDLCILSAMCLVKLSFVDGDEFIESLSDVKTSYILQGTVLLEYAWSHSKPNFQISLLLVRLYSMLGCGSLAMRAFQRMGVKQIQLDTLSYTLFDRISSLHPHSFGRNVHGSSQFLSPVEHLERQQMLYRKSRDHVSRNCWTSLEHGNYNSIFQIKEFEERMTRSMSAVMAVVETRKITRLIQPNVQQTTFSGGLDMFSKSICF